MNASLRNYKFPGPDTMAPEFIWDGLQFVNRAGELREILCYSRANSNWSDDLTQFHEQEAGSQHPMDQASRELAIQSINELCFENAPLVLDVGCSSGFFLKELTSRLPHVAVMGADYIEPPLRKLASQKNGIPLIQFDLRRCPLPEASIDGIVCLNVLEHIDGDVAALANIWRLLKPGGIAHVEVPSGPSLYDIYDEILMHHRRYRMGELTAKARQIGFEIVKSTHLGFFVFPAFALKKLWNKRWSNATVETKRSIVAAQIRNTSDGNLMRMLFKFEKALGRRVWFPWGIRCVLVLRKRV